MLIGIMTDSHENMDKIRLAVKVFNSMKIEHLYHCGDIISPITFKEFKELSCNIDFVFGNNDGEKIMLIEKFKGKGTFHQYIYEFEIDGKKFIMMHEPLNLEELIKSNRYDCIIYGHTHMQDIREGRPMVINIGETGAWLSGKSTIGVLDTSSMKLEIIEL